MTLKINSIGLNKEPKDTTVVVAMSGGVDSSTVAGMMKKEGYNVIGVTLKLYNESKENHVLVPTNYVQFYIVVHRALTITHHQ